MVLKWTNCFFSFVLCELNFSFFFCFSFIYLQIWPAFSQIQFNWYNIISKLNTNKCNLSWKWQKNNTPKHWIKHERPKCFQQTNIFEHYTGGYYQLSACEEIRKFITYGFKEILYTVFLIWSELTSSRGGSRIILLTIKLNRNFRYQIEQLFCRAFGEKLNKKRTNSSFPYIRFTQLFAVLNIEMNIILFN